MNLKAINELNIDMPEKTLGKGLQEPYNASNSSPRKQMFNAHNVQKIQLMNAEIPIISTGYENKYGEKSSCFVRTKSDMKIIAKIPKFSNHKDHIFYTIYYNYDTGKYNVFTVTPYEFISEMYGYMRNTTEMIYTKPGDIIPANSVISKSISYDEYNNRKDGVNLLTAYMAIDHTKEDSIVISESAQKKLVSPMFKTIEITINENDIPRNSYGNNQVYKFMPDLLEKTKGGLLCGIRRQKNEEAFFAQSAERLSRNHFDDDNFVADGQVIDIDIYCNNPERLGTTSYDDQLKYYYDDSIRMCQDIIAIVDSLGGSSVAENELQMLYERSKDILAGKKFKNQNGSAFSNIKLKVTVLIESQIKTSDKMSNRYGGKGVIAKVLPDALMPHMPDGRVIEVIQTKNTVIGRENVGQLWEVHLNHISNSIIRTIRSGVLSVEESYQLYRKFIQMTSSTMSQCINDYMPTSIDTASEQEIEMWIDTIMESDNIAIAVNPISDNMTIDKLRELYKEFPMAKPEYLIMPIISSTGEIEYIYGNRPMICGMEYYYRLKQIGEEKMSATSMSSTNLREMNVKSKLSKQSKHPVKNAPVKIGNMEFSELMHMGSEINTVISMIYSNSPGARRACIDLLIGDPFNPNIQLSEEVYNRSAEIFDVYMNTKGMSIDIEKIEKSKFDPFVITKKGQKFDPFVFLNTSSVGRI